MNDISKDAPSILEEVDSDNTIDQEERKGMDLNEQPIDVPNPVKSNKPKAEFMNSFYTAQRMNMLRSPLAGYP